MSFHCVLVWPFQDTSPRGLGLSLETLLNFASLGGTSDSNHSKIPVCSQIGGQGLGRTSFQFKTSLIAFCGHSEDVLQKQHTSHSGTEQALPWRWRSCRRCVCGGDKQPRVCQQVSDRAWEGRCPVSLQLTHSSGRFVSAWLRV